MLNNRDRGFRAGGSRPSRDRIAASPRPLTLVFMAALAFGGPSAWAQGSSTPPEPSAAQPSLPPPSAPNPSIVQSIVGPPDVRKAPPRHVSTHRRRHRFARRQPLDVERPALAGVQLLRPLPPPGQPPHFVVPTPAYPFENFVTAYTTPPAPLFCHPTPREPDLPDPRLYRQRTVICEPDNP